MTAAPPPAAHALVEEAAKKSALLWVRGPAGPSRPLWHVWADGAVLLVGAGPAGEGAPRGSADEQPLDGMELTDGGTAHVTARSKDSGGRLVAWPVRVEELPPHGEAWEAAVAALKGKRLNAPDAASVTERWARACRVLRLVADGPPTQEPGIPGTPGSPGTPGTLPDGSHAAPPLPTTATTRRPAPGHLAGLLLRRRGRGRG